ncbi:MAG: FAD binding domain-containing protein [Methylococcaceae bacterium]|nr:FAD binding domain-containing protein [Methylococcaceae bacterium]
MSKFLLNQHLVEEDLPDSAIVLDIIRHRRGLTGTKEVCREGDCGACQVLLGKLIEGQLQYQSVNACLLPLGAVAGFHVVTIEGINSEQLNPIQQALVANGAIQCGFCTPGLVMALTGFFLVNPESDEHAAVDAVAGNLCRCTGYTGIKRAIKQLCNQFDLSCSTMAQRVDDLIKWQILPAYFSTVAQTLLPLSLYNHSNPGPDSVLVAGGTDLFVQKPEWLQSQPLHFLIPEPVVENIRYQNQHCIIKATTTIEQLRTSPLMQQMFPAMAEEFKLICSAPIRQRATVGGNLVNASPIADLAIFFLALDARLIIASGKKRRTVALKHFFQTYKKIDLQTGEQVLEILFDKSTTHCFSYEKVSKRTYLDIASVNSAISIQQTDGRIETVHLAAGGVAAIPFYMTKTCAYLQGKTIKPATILEAAEIAQSEVAPISDIRGSAQYKCLLLRQLIFAHFLKLFPETINWESLNTQNNST